MLSMNVIVTYQKGFTLIELAIVLVIVGVLIGSFVGTIGARIDSTKRADTQSDFEIIKNAILGYAYSNDPPHLPCPCTTNCESGIANAGRENRDGNGYCTADATNGSLGYLPWGELGLKPSDSWNTLYRYWVDRDFSYDGSTPSIKTFGLSHVGNGLIRTRSPDGTATPKVATNAVVVVLTHGKNTYGGLSVDGVSRPAIPAGNVDEKENRDANSEFLSRTPTEPGASTAGGEFDDIVFWMAEYEIKARMVEVGLLPLP